MSLLCCVWIKKGQLLVESQLQKKVGNNLSFFFFLHYKQRHVNVIWQDMELMSRKEKEGSSRFSCLGIDEIASIGV